MWCVDDWVIVIQQVPPRPAKPVQPTCALPHCKHDGHFDTYSFRVSFEPLTQWNNQHIVDEPATSCKAEGHDSELGTTVTRSYWYHLDCFEEIFESTLGMLVLPVLSLISPPKVYESPGPHTHSPQRLYTGAPFSRAYLTDHHVSYSREQNTFRGVRKFNRRRDPWSGFDQHELQPGLRAPLSSRKMDCCSSLPRPHRPTRKFRREAGNCRLW